jgi:Na+-transporting methylmalonyl-CoA/oxaloacetate decarboxylase gamma subunit
VFLKLLVSTVYYISFVISTLVSIIKEVKKEREKRLKKVIEEQRNKKIEGRSVLLKFSVAS